MHAQPSRKSLIIIVWSIWLRGWCLPGMLLTSAVGEGVPGPGPGQNQPTAPDSGAGVFSGKLTVKFFAIEANALLKVPAAVVADPARLLEFLTRAPKDGMTCQIVAAGVAVQNGAGKWQDVKPWIYATEFQWKGDEVVPGPSKESLNVGSSIGVSGATLEAGLVKFTCLFEWVLQPGSRRIHGVSKDYGLPQQRHIRCQTSAMVPCGKSTLVAEWRSDITPPTAKPGNTWQYFLFLAQP